MKTGIVIGRFQVPGGPHEGHMSLFRSVLEENDNLIVVVGSVNRPESIKNPFSYEEREQNIIKALNRTQFKGSKKQVYIFPINDYLYNNTQWLADVDSVLVHALEEIYGSKEPLDKSKIRLYGHYKEGNDYLKWFPSYTFVNINAYGENISGTRVRKDFKHMLPERVQREMVYVEEEKAKFASYPYPRALNVNCGDAIVECSGHVLLIKRKHAPGEGNWGLPGGHKESDETFLDCAIRELYEETNLRIPEKVIRGSIVNTRLFDHPNRSTSGLAKSTLAVHIRINPEPNGTLPRANGCDDAAEASWVSISQALNQYPMHDDHADIISEMLGTRPKPAVVKFGFTSFKL